MAPGMRYLENARSVKNQSRATITFKVNYNDIRMEFRKDLALEKENDNQINMLYLV